MNNGKWNWFEDVVAFVCGAAMLVCVFAAIEVLIRYQCFQ